MTDNKPHASAGIRSAELAHLLDLVTPHIPKPRDDQRLAGVHAAIGDGQIILTATDRYTLICATAEAQVEGRWSGMVPSSLIKTLRQHTPKRVGGPFVTLRGDGTCFAADITALDPATSSMTLSAEAGQLVTAPVRKLLHRAAARFCPNMAAEHGVNPAYLARFAPMTSGLAPVQIGFNETGKMLILASETAIGAIALARHGGWNTGGPSVTQAWAARLAAPDTELIGAAP